MKIPTIAIPEVYHVGTLRAADRTGRCSLEAFMLSVSLDPEVWASIARCGGATFALCLAEARYLDVLALDDADMDMIMGWAVEAGHAVPATIWRAWSWDDERETWRYLEFADRGAAEREVDGVDPDEVADPEDMPSESGTLIDGIPGHVLTPAGMAALERWHAPTNARDGAVILWAREVAAALDPRLVGVWWDEDHDPEGLSCPRGGIFPDRLAEFEIRNLSDLAPGPACDDRAAEKDDQLPEP